MKTLLVILTAAFAWSAGAASEAQNELRQAHQRAFEVIKEIRDTLVPAPAVRFVETFPPIAGPRAAVLKLSGVEDPDRRREFVETHEHTLEKARETAVRAREQHEIAKEQLKLLAQAGARPVAEPPADPVPPVDPVAIADWATATARGALDGVFGGGFSRYGSGRAVRPPVIVGADAKNHAAIEEDLNVMMRILEKSAGAKDEGAKAMGIDVFSFSSSSAPRVFHLADYGALFVLRVRYPLLAPPKTDETSRTNEPTNTEWERARQEIYGTRGTMEELKWHMAREAGAAEDFDEERVEKLKNQIIDDLANARNIRHLKPDDFVTVVVLGAAPRAVVVAQSDSRDRGGRGGYARAEVRRVATDTAGQTTMTIRAKKSDIDAFAKGKLEAKEFRAKVSVEVH